ncbi:hypothetical protein Ato02nite_016410 [Paractinoplanes toevensis]|uniref:Uncharacterized protein n=2 Tax=Paractinoplanes toevensis TaxID=571911 RepID=A0A919T6M7_9ACTN|nr:hypothetical protein Ato02nite_016410 [Actinoplanes toevensis]
MIENSATGPSETHPDDFPDAHDFAVELTSDGKIGAESLNLAYRVPSLAIRVCWSWWSKPVGEIRAWTVADIPCGTLTKPYWDSDQGWKIMIWQSEDQIFVAEGDGEHDEHRGQDIYARWFKVSRTLYEAAWVAALDRLRAV